MPEILRPAGPTTGSCERRYVDAEGVAWWVRERPTLDRGPALYFISVGTFRRVTRYPDDWHDLTAGELEGLSRNT